MKKDRRKVLIASGVLLLILATSCNKLELYQELSEEDANEILVLLQENNIAATKKKVISRNEISWSISVSSKNVSRARSLLVQHSLPKSRELGLRGVYKEKGLIPTPDEQKARFLLALKGEIINSLQKIPDVVDADVVLNTPSVDEFADAETKKKMRPTASVVVKVKPTPIGGEVVISEAKIQQFVSNAVENLNPRDVTVIISYISTGEPVVRPGQVVTLPGTIAEPSSKLAAPSQTTSELVGLRLDADSKGRLKVYLLVFFLVLMILSSALIVVIVQGSRMRRALQNISDKGALAVEGEVLEEAPAQLSGANMPEGLESSEEPPPTS